MKQLKKWVALLGMLLVLVGCGQPAQKSAEKPQAISETEVQQTAESTATSDQKNDGYPLTVKTFDFGNQPVEITFEKAPEKVFVDGVNNVEIMLKLGLADKIALVGGVTQVSEDLKDEFAKVKTTETFPTKEEVIALEPDFLLAWYGAFQDKMLGDVGFWHDKGVNTYMSLNSYAQGPGVDLELKYEYEDILTIGKIFGVEDKARGLVDQIKGEVDKATAYVEGKDPVQTVILESISGGEFMIYGTDTLAGSMVKSLGAEQVMKETTKSNAESLISADPEVIFVVYFSSQSEAEAVDALLKNPALANVKAITSGRVYGVLLGDIYCSGLRTYNGLQTLTKGLYPELANN